MSNPNPKHDEENVHEDDYVDKELLAYPFNDNYPPQSCYESYDGDEIGGTTNLWI